MKKLLPALLCVACACAQAQADPFAPVAWLAGCWAQQGREAGSVENGRVVEFEFMQMRPDAQGQLSYVAQPQGRPPTEFKLLRQGEAEAVFENPAHDFPQRVLYRLAAPDRLVARIEGQLNGQERGIDFPMQRTACP